METKMIIRLVVLSLASLYILLMPLFDRYPKVQNGLTLLAATFIISSGEKVISSYYGIAEGFSWIISIAYFVILAFLSNKLAPYLRALLLRFR